MSNTGIYNKSGRCSITRADEQKFDDHELPNELAEFHAFHVDTPLETTETDQETFHKRHESDEDEHQSKDSTDESRRNSNVAIDSDEEYQAIRREKNERVLFTKLVQSRSATEWEDVGSQTDHSDMSEGHYSDETNEEKFNRELRNRTKSEKRVLRLARINEKHNIVE